MKHKLLFVYLFFLCISSSFGQGTFKKRIPGINQEKIFPNTCNLIPEMRKEAIPKPDVLKNNNIQPDSNPVNLPQAKTVIPSASVARTAAYTNTYNGVEYSSDKPYNVAIVWFVPTDVIVDPTYAGRLSAMVLYAQEWYRQQMINNGYGSRTFGLMTETSNPANVEIIVVNAAEPLSYYSVSHYAEEIQEVKDYLDSNPSLKTSEHTLIYTAGGWQNTTPFNISAGTYAFAVDIPDFTVQDLDPSTGYVYQKGFIGTMIHELGHALNINHSKETITEYQDPAKGNDIMSYGNVTFNVFPPPSAFLNRAGSAILSTTQTLAETPDTYYDGHLSEFKNLSATFSSGNLTLSGTFQSNKTVTDVNFYQSYEGLAGIFGSYDRVAWSVSPTGNSFTVTMPVNELITTTGPYYMAIELVLANGETEQYVFPFSYDNNSIPDLNAIKLIPILGPVPALCAAASPGLAIFSENFESGLGAFTTSYETPSATWEATEWIQTSAPRGSRAGKVAYGMNGIRGDCYTTDQSGIIRIESPVITIPAGTLGNLNMAFDHYMSTEEPWDGGNIKYSINGGAWTLLPASAFTANGYNKSLATDADGNTNPMQGQPAFIGKNAFGNIPIWGQSQINLTSIGLIAGANIRLRWEMGSDGCSAEAQREEGWYIDDITIYSCTTPAVHFALASETINESAAMTGPACQKYIDKTIIVQIDTAPSQPLTVTFTPTGTATMGANADYTIFPASVTLQAGALSQNVTVRVYNDGVAEGNETVDLSYTLNANGGNGHAAATLQSYGLTIVDNDVVPDLASAKILTIVNTANPAQQYLGPNATVNFTDPTTGFVMATIKNMSAFDYGCTTVEVNRAGADATSWFSGYKITNKTFKVNPSNINAMGNCEITLYYKASELGSFVPVSMGKSTDMIGAGNSAATSQTASTFGIGTNGNYAYTSTFNTGFSGFGLSDAPTAPLPVTLIKFEGKHSPEGNQLSWTTTAEVNNEYFAVEKSMSGLNFKELSRIAGSGTSLVSNTYKFTDSDFQKRISYYRLKQVDTDGTYAYSRIISVDGANLQDLKFFPNPVESLLTIELPDADMKAADVKVFNSAGQQILVSKKMTVINGQLTLDLNKLSTGIYQVILTNENIVKTMSVLKL